MKDYLPLHVELIEIKVPDIFFWFMQFTHSVIILPLAFDTIL